ncbi:biotin carboxylase [Oceanobacillus iheyensis HTE831]|uniref:biotin carboxylase n=1 Tax=Oceanobacillus iheyensis (strain DSM 14371 / CIP 107618 / JCM 11309 / KCTC 3954 / HTE831) TaxID=221109 RepID=Q8EQK2_OCEIH|nr:acetyl-CoA carboxylase biotin carboxylase subunit [Oceanobacillus iheyensis]BAC13652.1 biotin carboxylase [Oceanobacillus iheyensis HTE831]
MIKRMLIANRGEIARRIIRTCRQLNIETIAIYSDADKDALFVKEADESYLVGGNRVQESYLNVDKIFEIAKQANIDAIHPGYGFLSENASFANRCLKEKITFIGPSPEIIELMGDKIAARRTMKQAGVPIVPGTEEAISSVEEAVKYASEIGYPIMLKAAAGGGGIGMQIVHNDDELVKAFDSNSKRAANFFGNGSMFLEKKIEETRHIEFQVLADHHGNVVHLFERECSIQRRNQKVIEEAPSPFVSDRLRKDMGEASIRATKQINYTNAGTIEFLVDKEENYYFLEMNTRIQVEHPITEETTGIDIVEHQIKIAQGESLQITQNDIRQTGHAIEARIYAEDPITFFPSPGKITQFSLPKGECIRNECAVKEGDQVTPFYDPMIAKLIVTGDTRSEAIANLKVAMNQFIVEGIKTNITMIKEIIDYPAYVNGDTTTTFIQDYYQK